MRSFNATRRNRNMGTAKSGHGQNNRLTVPEFAHGEYRFWERIENAKEVSRIVSGSLIRFFVQPTRADCVHACTIDDLARLLSYLPAQDWAGIGGVLLRQPRRKEQTLEPVWGRLSYAADFADANGNVLYSGPAIVIEAVNPFGSMKIGKKLSLEGIAELERLKSDGHGVRFGDRGHTIEPTLESCRATQLYRTFPHEIGHWVDFQEKVERPAMADSSSDYGNLLDRFHSRPQKEREQFAHRYAEQLRVHLMARQIIPFDRQLDRERLQQDNLLLEDFEPSR
jgi:hypothetical protein